MFIRAGNTGRLNNNSPAASCFQVLSAWDPSDSQIHTYSSICKEEDTTIVFFPPPLTLSGKPMSNTTESQWNYSQSKQQQKKMKDQATDIAAIEMIQSGSASSLLITSWMGHFSFWNPLTRRKSPLIARSKFLIQSEKYDVLSFGHFFFKKIARKNVLKDPNKKSSNGLSEELNTNSQNFCWKPGLEFLLS